MPDDRTMARVAWLLPVACAAIAYFPITGNYFHADDFLDLYQLRNDDAAHYFLRMYGSHLLIARHGVTALFDALFGANPLGYFVVVLLTHLVNVAMVYLVALRLSGSWRLACVAAAMWGVAAVNEGALGWYAVYGQVVAATCTLLVLAGLAGAEQDARSSWGLPVRWALLMVLAGMMFGAGIAAALVMPIVAWLMLSRPPLRWRAIAAFVGAAALLMATYATLRKLELPLFGELRIETSFALAGLFNFGWHLPLLGTLLGFGLAQWPLGPLSAPLQISALVNVVPMVGGSLLVAAGFLCASPRSRRHLLACLLLVLAIYGLIAVARSPFIALPMGLIGLARSSRFHYAPGALLSLLLTLSLGAVAARIKLSARTANLLFAAWAMGLATLLYAVDHQINHFDIDRSETAAVLAEIRRSIAAAPPGGTVFIPNKPFGSVGMFNFGYRDRFPGSAAIFAIFYPDNVVDGRLVVFTSTDPLTLRGARGRRGATLLSRPPDLPDPGAAAKEAPP